MPTTVAVDDELLSEAKRVGGHRTKRETVNLALREFIARRRQAKIIDIFGTIEFDANDDDKMQRPRP